MLGTTPTGKSDERRLSTILEGPSRYDVALAIIPLALLCSLFASRLLGAPSTQIMAVGAAIGAAVVIDGMFLHPPRPES